MSLSYAEQLDKSSRRLEIKTRDGLFHHALSTEFNFSPRECSGVLDLMNDLYFGLRPLTTWVWILLFRFVDFKKLSAIR